MVRELARLGLLEAAGARPPDGDTARGRFVLNELVLKLASSFVDAREQSRA